MNRLQSCATRALRRPSRAAQALQQLQELAQIRTFAMSHKNDTPDLSGRSQSVALARPSASLILLSPLSSPTSDGFDYKVCLLKRNATMSAAPSATVFPGGNLSEADTKAASGIGQKDASMTALRICALRETFEEIGILITNPKSKSRLGKEALSEWRKRVYKDPSLFENLYQAAGPDSMPALDSLVYWSRWITPVSVPKRFDTSFFLYILPAPPGDEEQGPLLAADGSETLSAEWITPRQAIDACIHRKEIILFPPQVYLLAELCRTPTLASVGQRAKSHQAMTILPVMKRVGAKQDQIAFVYPEDEEYGDSTAGLGVRHRTYVPTVQHPKKGLVPVNPPQVKGQHRKGVRGMDDFVEGVVEEMEGSKAKL